MNPLGLAFFVLYWVVFLYSVVLHELAHGYMALRLGDTTALRAGRLSLNPIRHIDPFSSILMPLMLFIMSSGTFIFGGAKPVPVNPLMYRNKRLGSLLDAAAGPATNFMLAAVFALALTVSRITAPDNEITTNAVFFSCCMMINIFLGAFNLLPIPPLDGSHVLEAILPEPLAEAYGKLRHFGFILLVGLLVFPPTGSVIYSGLSLVVNGFLLIVGVKEVPAANPLRLIGY